MKRTFLLVLISFCLIIFVPVISSAKKLEMKLNLNRGERYTYAITQENSVKDEDKLGQIGQKMTLKIEHKVIDRLNNGNYWMEANYKRFQFLINENGRVFSYDSDTVDFQNKLYKTLEFLTEIKLNYELSPEGVVSKLSGFDTLKEKIKSDRRLIGLLLNFGSEQIITEMYNYIPAVNVEVGDKWKTPGILPELKFDINYTLKEASLQNLKLDQEASFSLSYEDSIGANKVNKMKETGIQKGKLVIDPKTRMRLSSDIEQEIEVVKTPDQSVPDKKEPVSMKYITRTNMVLVK